LKFEGLGLYGAGWKPPPSSSPHGNSEFAAVGTVFVAVACESSFAFVAGGVDAFGVVADDWPVAAITPAPATTPTAAATPAASRGRQFRDHRFLNAVAAFMCDAPSPTLAMNGFEHAAARSESPGSGVREGQELG
jgi:hypothetical protein